MGLEVEERWEEFPRASKYEISTWGRVYSHISKKILKPFTVRGQLKVDIKMNDGVQRAVAVHQMVAETYLPEHKRGVRVYHIDGDNTNNHVSNIVSMSPVEGLSRGDYTEADVRGGRPVRIIETGKVYANAKLAADKIFGDHACIYRCLRGGQKTHLGLTFEYAD